MRHQENAAKLPKPGADGVVAWGTTPPFANKRANGTPPNLGGESSLLVGLPRSVY